MKWIYIQVTRHLYIETIPGSEYILDLHTDLKNNGHNWLFQRYESYKMQVSDSLIIFTTRSGYGPHLNIKTIFPKYENSHFKDKTVARPSYL